MQTRIECSLCSHTTWADTRALEPAATQPEPGMVAFVVYCDDCGRAHLALEDRARWEAETGRTAPPPRPAGEEGDARAAAAPAAAAPAPRDAETGAGVNAAAAAETTTPVADVPVIEGVMRPSAGAAYGAREFDYVCPHCGARTRLDPRSYDLLTFHRRDAAAEALDLSGAHAPFLDPVQDLIRGSVGDDFLAFRCTGCAAPVVAVFTREALAHARNLYHVERVYELRSWTRPPAGGTHP